MLKPSELHARISDSIVTKLADPTVPGAWRESRVPFDLFGSGGRESPEVEHHGFALGLPSTSPLPGERQQRDIGVLSFTTVAIRWAHRLRTEAVVLDTRSALDAEIELVNAVLGTGPDPRLHVRLSGLARRSARNGLVFIGEATFEVGHYYPLEG